MSTPEKISVCENICRDFPSWSADLLSLLGNLGSLLAGIAAMFAVIQVKQWRKQAQAMSRADIARSVMASCYEVDDILRSVRNPFISIPIENRGKKGVSYEIKHRLLAEGSDSFRRLRASQIEQEIVIGSQKANAAIDVLFEIRGDIFAALEWLFELSNSENRDAFSGEDRELTKKYRAVVGGAYRSGDETSLRQDAAILTIREELEKYARLAK